MNEPVTIIGGPSHGMVCALSGDFQYINVVDGLRHDRVATMPVRRTSNGELVAIWPYAPPEPPSMWPHFEPFPRTARVVRRARQVRERIADTLYTARYGPPDQGDDYR